MKRFLSFSSAFSLFLAMAHTSAAQTEPVVAPIADMLDSISSQKMFEAALKRPIFNKNNKYKFAEDSIPLYEDHIYEARLAKLDASSPCDLVYNSHVKSYIQLYTVRKRESVSRMLGMA